MLAHNSGKCSWRGLGRAAFPISFSEHCGKPCDRQWQEEKEDKQSYQSKKRWNVKRRLPAGHQTLTRWEPSIGSWCSTALGPVRRRLCALRISSFTTSCRRAAWARCRIYTSTWRRAPGRRFTCCADLPKPFSALPPRGRRHVLAQWLQTGALSPHGQGEENSAGFPRGGA